MRDRFLQWEVVERIFALIYVGIKHTKYLCLKE